MWDEGDLCVLLAHRQQLAPKKWINNGVLPNSRITSNASLLMLLSAMDVCFCASSDGCSGGQIDAPWEYIKSHGAVLGGQHQDCGPGSVRLHSLVWPLTFGSDKYTYLGQVSSASGVLGIQQMITSGGPVETALTVYSDFKSCDGGVYHLTSGSNVGRHAMKIVG